MKTKNYYLTQKWVLLFFGFIGVYMALMHHGIWSKPEKWLFLILLLFWLLAFFAPRLPLPVFILCDKLWTAISFLLVNLAYALLYLFLIVPWSLLVRLSGRRVFRIKNAAWKEIEKSTHFLQFQTPERRSTFVAEILMFLICDRLYWFWSFLLLCLFFGGGFFLTSSDPGAAPFIYTLF